MAKKDFSTINTGDALASKLESATGRQGQQATVTEEEKKERMDAMKTQGRKGCKAIRINMAFQPQVHEYIKMMARATGKNMTEVTNAIIMQHMREHPESYLKAKQLMGEIGEEIGWGMKPIE